MTTLSDDGKYVSLSTRKRDSSFVDTPVWFAAAAETGIFYVFSLNSAGKVKRIRNFTEAKVAPCDMRGKLKGDWIDARVELVDDADTIAAAERSFRKKYGVTMAVSNFFSRLVGNYQRRQYIRFRVET
jgi:PPOX class probable F420-dependent enzyme